MIAFEAATPFQIFNCINLLRTKKETADLFLYTYAADLDDIAKRLEYTNLFEHVYIIRNIPQKSRSAVAASIMKPEIILKDIEVRVYKELYISYTGFPNLLLYNVLRNRNEKLKLYFYEDGVTSYYCGTFQHSKKIDIIRKLRGLRNDSKDVSKVLLYEPRLNRVEYKDVVIEAIEPVHTEQDFNIIQSIFNISGNTIDELNNFNYIYFDHNFKKYITNEFFFNFSQVEIVNKIAELADEQVVVKLSPLAEPCESEYFGKNICVSNFGRAPWEVLICRDENLEAKCLITVCSNAVITPKTVYKKEPYVLILGKALYLSGLTNSTDIWTDKMEQFYKDVQALYVQKEKFMIPDSLEEGYEWLKKVPVLKSKPN